MDFALSILGTAGLVLIVFHFWRHLEPNGESEAFRKSYVAFRIEFFTWAAKAIGFPLLVWILINVGAFPGLPILLRPVAMARAAGGDWLAPLFKYASTALLIIASFWTAIALIWLLFKLHQLAADQKEFRGVLLFWVLLLSPFAAGVLWMGGLSGAGLTITLWLLPAVHVCSSLIRDKTIPPSYGKATGLLKMGKYKQAEWEVIRELENCENDFQGWMMLAELYAVHFHDMTAAEQAIYELCSQPETNASQICTAVYKLSEWHLKVAEDPEAARRVLEVICKKWPGTHMDKMARLEMQRIPASREALARERQGRPIPMPALQDISEEEQPRPAAKQGKAEAAAQANRCTEKLKLDPDNVVAREEFARILAERLDKPELAIEQLELLLEMPGQTDQNRAEWLSLEAAWHFRYRRDNESGKKVLQQLVQEYPQSVQAFTAQRRLNLLAVEERMRRSRAGKG